MAAEQRFQELLQRNEKYAETHVAPGTLKAMIANAPPNFQGLYILTCADRRVIPEKFLGINGDANVVRSAGGRVDNGVLRSLEIMGTILPIGYIAVIQHTDCGGLNTTDDEIREKLIARSPAHASHVKGKVFRTFRDIGIEKSLQQDVEELTAWPFLPKGAKVAGYVYELETGLLREVVPATTKD